MTLSFFAIRTIETTLKLAQKAYRSRVGRRRQLTVVSRSSTSFRSRMLSRRSVADTVRVALRKVVRDGNVQVRERVEESRKARCEVGRVGSVDRTEDTVNR